MIIDNNLKIVIYILAAIIIIYALYKVITSILRIRVQRAINITNNGEETTIILKRCPFCGKNLVELYNSEDDNNKYYHMVCPVESGGCGSSTGMYETEMEAIIAWNLRSRRDDD